MTWFNGLNYGFVIASSLLFAAALILTILDLRLRHKINTDLKAIFIKEGTTLSNLGEQILTIIIHHGGKMNLFEISSYLDMPVDLVVQKLKVMERDKLIIRKGLSEVYAIRQEN